MADCDGCNVVSGCFKMVTWPRAGLLCKEGQIEHGVGISAWSTARPKKETEVIANAPVSHAIRAGLSLAGSNLDLRTMLLGVMIAAFNVVAIV